MPHQPIYSLRRQPVTKLAPKQIGMFHVKHLKTITPVSGTVSRETDLPSRSPIRQPLRHIHLTARDHLKANATHAFALNDASDECPFSEMKQRLLRPIVDDLRLPRRSWEVPNNRRP